MYLQGRDKAKIGKVSIDRYKNSYRARFTYPKGKRHQIIVSTGTEEGWIKALPGVNFPLMTVDGS